MVSTQMLTPARERKGRAVFRSDAYLRLRLKTYTEAARAEKAITGAAEFGYGYVALLDVLACARLAWCD